MSLSLSRLALSLGGRFNPDQWGATGEEALLPYPPGSFRSTYTFGTQVEILSHPAWMSTDKGPYWPNALLKSAGQLPSDYPVDIMVYYSTDHAHTGGGVDVGSIGVICGRTDLGEPTKFDWLDYAAAVSAGWFDTIATKPAGDKLISLSTQELETPDVHWDSASGNWYMYAQCYVPKLTVGGAQYRADSGAVAQGTIMLTSTNGLDWKGANGASLTASNAVAVLNDAANISKGDGHTGYFRCAPNILPGIPYAWVGYSLAGGTSFGTFAQWGADSVAGPWTKICNFGMQIGRAVSAINTAWCLQWNTIEPRSIRKTRQGYAVIGFLGESAAGGAYRSGGLYEILLDNEGREIIAKPQLVLAATAGFSADACNMPSIITDVANDRRCIFFLGQNKTTVLEGLGTADGALRNPGNTYFDTGLTPAIPASMSDAQSFDMTAQGGVLPARLAAVVASGATYEVDANGFTTTFTTPDTAMTIQMSLFDTVGFIPNNVTFAEIYVEDEQGLTADSNHWNHIGFARAQDMSRKDRISMETSATSTFLYMRTYDGTAGTARDSKGPSLIQDGMPYGTGKGGRRWPVYGFRWFPASRKFITLMGHPSCECEYWDIPAGWDLSQRVYPFLAWGGTNLAAKTIQQRIRTLNYRWG